MKKLLIICLPMLLGACAFGQTVWVKPNGTVSEIEQIKAICMTEGFERIPAKNKIVMTQGASAYSNGCKGNNCFRSFTPPQYNTVDENQELRDQVVRACMYRNGCVEAQAR